PFLPESHERGSQMHIAGPNEIEIDISDEWQPASTLAAAAAAEFNLVASNQSDDDVIIETDEPSNSPAAELLEEIRFYIGQQMWEEAAAIIRKCAGMASQIPELPELTEQIEAAIASAAANSAPVSQPIPSQPAVSDHAA